MALEFAEGVGDMVGIGIEMAETGGVAANTTSALEAFIAQEAFHGEAASSGAQLKQWLAAAGLAGTYEFGGSVAQSASEDFFKKKFEDALDLPHDLMETTAGLNMFSGALGDTHYRDVRQAARKHKRFRDAMDKGWAELEARGHKRAKKGESIFPGAPELPAALAPHFFNLKRLIFPETMALNAQVFPRKITKTLRWSAPSGQITVPSNGQCGSGALKANSLIDVGASATPLDVHEPLGFIQMQGMYEQYVVKKATIRWDYFNSHPDGNANPDSVVVGISVKDDPTTILQPGHYQELGSSVWQVAPPEGSGKLVYEVFPPKFFGVSVKNASTDATLKAGTQGLLPASQPDNLLYFHIWAHGTRTPDLPFVLHGHVTIDFEIEFFEPRAITQANYTPANPVQ